MTGFITFIIKPIFTCKAVTCKGIIGFTAIVYWETVSEMKIVSVKAGSFGYAGVVDKSISLYALVTNLDRSV